MQIVLAESFSLASLHIMKPKILTTLQTYSWSLFWADVMAGITVAMVALPLSLAIAIASGADPAKGIVTAIVGGFLVSLLGGSRVQIGEPTGAFIVVVFGVISQHGFTIGIAVIIATSQLKDIFGLSIESLPADFLEKLPALWDARATASYPALGIGLATIGLIVLLRRLAPRAPGLIVAVALTSAAAMMLAWPVESIGSRFGVLPSHLPMPSFPTISLDRVMELLPSAFVIAFLAGVESLLSAMVADKMTGGHHRPNAKVIAQGFANVGSSLFGGMPATGAIARTATNVRAGGKTPVAGIVHALAILVVMLVAAPLAGYLAMPALAGLLILTAWTMSEPHKWKGYLSAPRSDQFLLILTLVLTVVADLTVAIGVGVSVGLALRLRRRNVPPADWETPDR